MKHRLIVSMVMMFGAMAFARGGDFGVGNGGDGLDKSFEGTGTPSPAANRALFVEMKQEWEQGSSLSEQNLPGKWKLVVTSASTACQYAYGKNVYAAGGIKNSDGSIPALEFKSVPRFASDFLGKSPTAITVGLLSFGKKSNSEGPHQVNPAEPHFAQWSKKDLEKDTSYFEYSCRAIGTSNNKMVCGLRLHVAKEPRGTLYSSLIEKASYERLYACVNDDMGVVLGFVKQ